MNVGFQYCECFIANEVCREHLEKYLDCIRAKLISTSLHVRYISEAIGQGVFTMKDLQPGSFVLIYYGEIVSTIEAKSRQQNYDKLNSNYLLTIREHGVDAIYRLNVDATHRGGLARFINHSCEPNCEIIVYRESPDQVVGVPIVRVLHKISSLEELTISYGEGEADNDERTRKRCDCRSARCRGYLPLDLI